MQPTASDPIPHVIRHVVEQEADVLIVSHDAGLLAAEMGFPQVAVAEIRIVARELATNIVKYARRGSMTVSSDDLRITIEAVDEGPGIPSIEEALTDGFSSSGSLGYGLGTVNRIMDALEIKSNPVQGTHVITHRSLKRAPQPAFDLPVDIGVATTPKPGFTENGDGYLVRSWGHHTLLAVCDGVGHGAPAQAAALAATGYLETHADQPFGAMLRGVHVACRGTRGVVLALARFNWAMSSLEFSSMGNIESRVLGADRPLRLMVRRGILGGSAPEPHVATHPWDSGATLVMFTDGVASHWVPGDVIATDSAEATARTLLTRYNRLSDDATVLVLKPRQG